MPQTHDQDKKLITLVQNGNVLAFEKLIIRYQNHLINFVNKIVHNRKDAEEIVQDTFLKIYQTIDRVDPEKKFSSYLFTIAKNTAISHLRQKKFTLPLKEDLLVHPSESHLESLAKSQDQQTIKNIINKLPSSYRSVINLYYFQDLSYEQISQKLLLPINTVRTHLRRAKEKLRYQLASLK